MNLGQLRTRCAKRFRDPDFVIVAAATWTDHLNAALFDFYSALPDLPGRLTRTTLTFPANTQAKPLPADVFHVRSVHDVTHNAVLRAISGYETSAWRWWDDELIGTPFEYRVVGSQLELYPVPDEPTTVRIEYFRAPTPMSADTDSPDLPVAYHEALVYGALARAWEDEGDQRSEQARARFLDYVKLATKDTMRSKHATYPTVTDRFFS